MSKRQHHRHDVTGGEQTAIHALKISTSQELPITKLTHPTFNWCKQGQEVFFRGGIIIHTSLNPEQSLLASVRNNRQRYFLTVLSNSVTNEAINSTAKIPSISVTVWAVKIFTNPSMATECVHEPDN
jgi:hypothetical protein